MLRRNMLVVGVVVCILAISGSVAALGDDTGDVWHYQETDGGWSWDKYSGEKPNLDITEVSFSFDGNAVTLTMKVSGEIENAEDITYWIHLEGDASNYVAQYSNTEGWVGGEGAASGFYRMLDDPVSGDTFTATFEVDNPDESYSVYGYTVESASSEEQWGDYAPSEYAPWDSGDDTDEGDTGDDATDGGDDDTDGTSDGGDGTPGFELPFVFLAMVVVSIILVKRKEL